MKKIILAASVLLLASTPALAAGAAKSSATPERDPYGYYSDQDKEGYYDREGNYVRYSDHQPDADGYTTFNPPPRLVYKQGDYEARCRRGHQAAGTFFGALAGGLIGDAASRGGPGWHRRGSDPGAVIGGIILGGMLGNAIGSDIPCEDHSNAFGTYAEGLNGRLGETYEWSNEETGDHGSFVPEREFRREGRICRAFHETTTINGRYFERSGIACRGSDGNWHFD